jgi:Down syndrome cell adhesion protein
MPIHFAWFKDGEHISAALQVSSCTIISIKIDKHTVQVEERAAEFYSILIFKEVSSRHSGAYTCVASNSAARANYTAKLMVKGRLVYLRGWVKNFGKGASQITLSLTNLHPLVY